MNVVALKYKTPTGVKTAYAFLDDDGFVVREKGLCGVAAGVRGGSDRPTADDIKTFLDLGLACPNPKWDGLRQRFAAELQAATSSNCTRCKRDAISRKYAKRLFESNL